MCLFLVRQLLVVFNLMHQIPSAYTVTHTERCILTMYAFYANACSNTAERIQKLKLYIVKWAKSAAVQFVWGPDDSRKSQWFWFGKRNIPVLRAQSEPEPDLSLCSDTSLCQSRSRSLSGSPDPGAKMRMRMRSAYQDDCFFVFPLLAVVLMLVSSFLCCSTSAVKQTLKGSVSKNAAMSWDELVLVFERRPCPWVSIGGGRWRELWQDATAGSNFALPYFTANHKDHTQVS